MTWRRAGRWLRRGLKGVCLLGWPALAYVVIDNIWRHRRGLHAV